MLDAGWQFLCGLDFGIVDRNAVAVLGWRPHDPVLYVAECYKLTATPSEMAEEVRELEATYRFARIVGDVGGMGKAFEAEMRRRCRLPIEPAEKHNKLGYIALFNADLKRGRIKVVRDRCAELLEEWRVLPWADNRMKEAGGFENHCADATLYGWRASSAFLAKPATERVAPGTAERASLEERRLEREIDRELADERRERARATRRGRRLGL